MKTLFPKFILLVATLWLSCSAHAAQNILVYGDSLSAGYGIAVEESWPALLQQELNVSDYRVINASISGETTQGGRQRISQTLLRHRPAVVILALGANDGLRGYNPTDIEENLNKLILDIKRSGASVLLVGMRLPPNYGKAYTSQFEALYTQLAKKRRVRLIPFLLEGVPPEQFQRDYLHPVAAAQPRIMQNVLKELKPLLD